ncbi:hypothetical protein R5R35_006662 [Gryllus longicercus]|uniref:Uncharacterized protein n=1 Tax=Gryllus longicercus TaxID=2509291 RepID=A0AAN9ZCT9_9ORTH
MDYEELFAEFVDREQRSKNIIMYGIEENTNVSAKQDDAVEGNENTNVSAKDGDIKDREKVTSILSKIINPIPEFKTYRLGNPKKFANVAADSATNERTRPLKVVFLNSSQSLRILKNKKKYNGNVRMGPDRTMRQRQHLKSVISKCEVERESGNKNAKIKYIKGIPRLITNATEKPITIDDSIVKEPNLEN